MLTWFGELHPRVIELLDAKGPISGFELFLDALPPAGAKAAKAKAGKARPQFRPSPFQPVERDFAFVVDAEVPAEKLVRAAKGAEKTLIADVAVFDVYTGAGVEAGKKSLAVAVTLQPTERTLTDADIDAVSQRIVDAVAKTTGAVLRA